MWDDFSIGNVGNSAGARTVAGNLSENSMAYWWSTPVFRVGGKVAKDTPEGAQITTLVKEGATEKQVDRLLLKIALATLSPNKLLGLLDRTRQQAFEEGEAHRTEVIRTALAL